MSSVFSRRGASALLRLSVARSVLAFDLDGTLAPIVAHRDQAQVPPLLAFRLRALSHLWPVAVLTGRAPEDARARLGFKPRYLYGHHGAQNADHEMPSDLAARLNPLRLRIQDSADELRSFGIDVEDKGLSLALHYRAAVDPAAARRWLDAFGSQLPAEVVASPGHSVLNVTLSQAANKGDALLKVMRDEGATSALVIGDDANDEPAFANAPEGSVCVRIGAEGTPTAAGFRLDAQPQVSVLLSMLLALRAGARATH